MVQHACNLQEHKTEETSFKKKLRLVFLVSPTNPLRINYFKSDLSIRLEQARHLRINRYAIHPFSNFRGMYEIYLIFLYTSALLVKPMAAFLRREHYVDVSIYREFAIMLDFFCMIDIIMTFFTGFTKQPDRSNFIELRWSRIARNYITGPYFLCDVLSSVPKGLLYDRQNWSYTGRSVSISGVLDFFMFLKFVRVKPLFSYIYRTAQYLQFRTKGGPFLVCTLLLTLFIIHLAACMQFGVPKITVYFAEHRRNQSWVYRMHINEKRLFEQYTHAFFKGSAYILGIQQNLYGIQIAEEYLIALLTYFIGKLLIAFVWLILAMAILNSRSIDIKFLELINQLEEYMRRKKLPLNLRERISQYYHYKYQKRYFKEDFISSSLPDIINREVKMHICKTMIKSVSLFADLTYDEVSALIEYLVPEIFLPQDTIIQHGTYGDAMYFLSSGTVAVFTRSGKEICHLQDGAYFGEISLLLPDQTRNASIVAIETSQVYRLKRRDFERCLLKNKFVLEKIMIGAEDRLREATQIEDAYKKYLFEQAYQSTRFSASK